MKPDPNKWYFNTYAYIIAFLCIGPLALPLAWINPRYSMAKKVAVTIITLIVSYFLVLSFSRSVESICRYYQEAMKLLR